MRDQKRECLTFQKVYRQSEILQPKVQYKLHFEAAPAEKLQYLLTY